MYGLYSFLHIIFQEVIYIYTIWSGRNQTIVDVNFYVNILGTTSIDSLYFFSAGNRERDREKEREILFDDTVILTDNMCPSLVEMQVLHD